MNSDDIDDLLSNIDENDDSGTVYNDSVKKESGPGKIPDSSAKSKNKEVIQMSMIFHFSRILTPVLLRMI